MTTSFCINNKNLYVTNLNSLLNNCNGLNGFNKIFSQEPANTLLAKACGSADSNDRIISIYTSGVINTSIPAISNFNIFSDFWNNSSEVETFTEKINDLLLQIAISSQSVIYYPILNDLFSYLFYYLFCVSSSNKNIFSLDNSNIINNWRYFLAHNRGIASLTVCDYCIEDQFMPYLANSDPSKAGEIIRQLLANDPIMKTWCGCCVPDKKDYEYPSNNGKKYNFLNPFFQDKIKFPLYCEGICNNPDYNIQNEIENNNDIIPLINGDKKYVNASGFLDANGNIDLSYIVPVCNSNICVIDNITIEAVSTQGKGITFSQVCPGCASRPGNCICYSYGKDVFDKINSGSGSMQDPVIFKQNCPNSLCYQKQVNGKYQEVKCNTVNPANTGKAGGINYNGNGIFNNLKEADVYGIDTWLFPISLTVIFIIFFLAAIFTTLYRNQLEPNKRHNLKANQKIPQKINEDSLIFKSIIDDKPLLSKEKII